MISSVIIIYFLGLFFLFASSFIGLFLFRFKKTNLFFELFFGFLLIISTYAIIKSKFNSVGLFVLLWLVGYFVLTNKNNSNSLIRMKEIVQKILIISVLWTTIFILKASFFWNSEYNCPNLLFTDYEFYIKIAEGYNLSGNENAMGLRNFLFPYLNFAQPYRASDFWIVSIGLDSTKIDTIFIWELFYSTILIFICSLSLFVVLKRKFSLFLSLFFSVLFLFAFSGSWYRDIINFLFSYNSGSYDPIGIIAYTKLAIVFSIFFQFIIKYENGEKMESIYLLILIPILIQSAIAIFLFIPLIILFCFFKEENLNKDTLKKYLPLILLFAAIVIGIVFFYYLNQKKEQLFMGYTNMNIVNNHGIFDFVIQFVKKSVLLFVSYFWLSIFLALVLLFLTKSLKKQLRIDLGVFLLLCYFSTIFVYAKYNKIGDAYQFSTNVFGPFVLSIIIYLLIETPIKNTLGKINVLVLVLISIVGANGIIAGNNVFHSTNRLNYYSKEFINETKQILPTLKFPIGLIFYGKNLQNYSKEDFPLHDATFLKLFGRNYDVFNIEADSLKIDLINESIQKKNASINRNALNIWKKNTKRKDKNKLKREDFYKAYPFSFCISKKPKDSLPVFIKADVISIIRDQSSKIYFYTLDR